MTVIRIISKSGVVLDLQRDDDGAHVAVEPMLSGAGRRIQLSLTNEQCGMVARCLLGTGSVAAKVEFVQFQAVNRRDGIMPILYALDRSGRLWACFGSGAHLRWDAIDGPPQVNQ